jgi:hypothetical protein
MIHKQLYAFNDEILPRFYHELRETIFITAYNALFFQVAYKLKQET